MSRWEEPRVVHRYPERHALPANVRVDPAAHPARWLVDGTIREVPLAASAPVVSRVALRDGDTPSVPLLGHEAVLGADDAREALAAAGRAWAHGEGAWPAAHAADRARAVSAFADAVAARTDDIATLLMWEIGKPRSAARDEVTRSVDYIRNTLHEFARLRAEDHALQTGTAGGRTHHAYTERRPLGKVLCVAPFNLVQCSMLRET